MLRFAKKAHESVWVVKHIETSLYVTIDHYSIHFLSLSLSICGSSKSAETQWNGSVELGTPFVSLLLPVSLVSLFLVLATIGAEPEVC